MTETTDQLSEPKDVRFNFTGAGSEFFRIWIVNLVLTILTLGIYSAWAKVRTNRYFYGSTELDGDAFEYHAEPIQILKGRLIAVAALVVYAIAQAFFPIVSIFLFFVLIGFLPLIIVRSLRFRAVMSSWRGIRFGFQASPWEAAKAYIFWPIFGVLTLGLGMPYAWFKQNHFAINHHLFGRSGAASTTNAGDFYGIFLTIIGVSLVLFIVLMIITVPIALVGGTEEGEAGFGIASVILLLGYFLFYVIIYAVFQALRYAVVYGNISIDDTTVHNDVNAVAWTKIVVLNSILMLVTIGLYYPWARVRLTQYMLTATWLKSPDLTAFAARHGEDENSLGEEIGEAFDLGIGV